MPIAGWVQIIGFIGVLETTTLKQDPRRRRATSRRPLPPLQPRRARDGLISELKNILAMMGIMGMLVTTSSRAWPDPWLIKARRSASLPEADVQFGVAVGKGPRTPCPYPPDQQRVGFCASSPWLCR